MFFNIIWMDFRVTHVTSVVGTLPLGQGFHPPQFSAVSIITSMLSTDLQFNANLIGKDKRLSLGELFSTVEERTNS